MDWCKLYANETEKVFFITSGNCKQEFVGFSVKANFFTCSEKEKIRTNWTDKGYKETTRSKVLEKVS